MCLSNWWFIEPCGKYICDFLIMGTFIDYIPFLKLCLWILDVLAFWGDIIGKVVPILLWSLKKGCSIAAFTVILFDGSRCIIWVKRSTASGGKLLSHSSLSFSFPLTYHFGKDTFISGSSSEPCQLLSLGVPRTLKILKSWPISLSP